MKNSIALASLIFISCGLFSETSQNANTTQQQPVTQSAVNELRDLVMKVQREVDDWVGIRDGHSDIARLCDRIAPICSSSTVESTEPKIACLWLMKCSELAQVSSTMAITIDRDFIGVFQALHDGDLAKASSAIIRIIGLIARYEQVLEQGKQLHQIFTHSLG